MTKIFAIAYFFSGLTLCHAKCEPRLFTDTELQQWKVQHERGLILVVSEGMPYSMKSIPQLEQAAKKRKLPLLVLMDQAAKTGSEGCYPVLKSNELFSRGALRHFPNLFFIHRHKLSTIAIPGIQTTEELERNLDREYGITN